MSDTNRNTPLGQKQLREAEPVNRVVLAIGQLHRGGTEGQLVQLAKGLKARGIDVAVACLWSGGVYAAELENLDIPVFHAEFPRKSDGFLGLFSFPLAFGRYVRWLNRQKPDLVHAFLYHAYITSAFAARLARVHIVVAGRRSLGGFKDGRPWVTILEKLATAMTTVVVANSRAVAEDTFTREGLEPEKLRVIHNGLDPSAFQNHKPAKIKCTGPLIICVANFRIYKGHTYLIQAAARLVEMGFEFCIALAGSAMNEADEARRNALALEGRDANVDIRFLGSRDDVPRLLAAADIFVLPSIAEGFSNSLLEAMAAGLPIVATDVGGNAEALAETGIIVPPRDPAALSQGLALLLTDTHRASELGKMARDRAFKEFSMTITVQEHLALYDSLARSLRFKNRR